MSIQQARGLVWLGERVRRTVRDWQRERGYRQEFLRREARLHRAYQGWLWRNNRELAKKLSKEEHWEW